MVLGCGLVVQTGITEFAARARYRLDILDSLQAPKASADRLQRSQRCRQGKISIDASWLCLDAVLSSGMFVTLPTGVAKRFGNW